MIYNLIDKSKCFIKKFFKSDKDFKGKDKIKHFLICSILSIIDTKITIGVALGKEMGDYFNSKSHWCWWDLVADGLGIITGTLIRLGIISIFI